jgi:flavin-binding protein dodecin
VTDAGTHPDADDHWRSVGEEWRMVMAVAKVIEITSASSEGFEDAIRQGIAKASETVRDIKGAWVSQQTVKVENGTIVEYRTDLKISFVLE